MRFATLSLSLSLEHSKFRFPIYWNLIRNAAVTCGWRGASEAPNAPRVGCCRWMQQKEWERGLATADEHLFYSKIRQIKGLLGGKSGKATACFREKSLQRAYILGNTLIFEQCAVQSPVYGQQYITFERFDTCWASSWLCKESSVGNHQSLKFSVKNHPWRVFVVSLLWKVWSLQQTHQHIAQSVVRVNT